MRTIIEPFRIKMVEPLALSTPKQREQWLEVARHNVFLLRGEQVTIDLLTDSGTGAMSAQQWAALMQGDETYAGSSSFYELESVVRDLSGMRHIFPTHQGRAAEHLLFRAMGVHGKTVLANAHFDTTRANIEFLGGMALDLLIAEAHDPQSEHPFKGNLDLEALERELKSGGDDVAMVLITVTNNTGGGQPVSLANMREASRLAHRYGKPFFLDAARFAENAWFIKQREPEHAKRSILDIARQMFSLADGFTMSGKKDGLVNIGGLLCLNDSALADEIRALLILTEGFPTYGGLAGRDLAAFAQGLREVTEESYLEYRAASTRYLFNKLDALGVPLMRPAGGHAVYVDARRMYPQIPPEHFPGLALVNALYLEGGIRAVEVGSFMFGSASHPDHRAALELVRLTIPRRTYTQSHVDYVAEVVQVVHAGRDRAHGYRVCKEPRFLRAFSAELEPMQQEVITARA